MGSRRKSRELAMQALFYMDMRRQFSKEMLAGFYGAFLPSKKEPVFFKHIVDGVLNNSAVLDNIIIKFSDNWKMSRMSCVDRNVMRIAVYEMLYRSDIPLKVSINEAVDIGKKFGTDESGAFINGILDSIRIALENREIDITAVSAARKG